jgi:hypothetical protein
VIAPAHAAMIEGHAPFYGSNEWEGVPVKAFEGPQGQLGQRLDYYCDYVTRTTTSSRGPADRAAGGARNRPELGVAS